MQIRIACDDSSKWLLVCSIFLLFIVGFSVPTSTALTNVALFSVLLWSIFFIDRRMLLDLIRDPVVWLPVLIFILLLFSQLWFLNPDGWAEVSKSRKLLLLLPLLFLMLNVGSSVRAIFVGFCVASVITLSVSIFVWLSGISVFGVSPDNAFVFKNHITQNFLMAFFAYCCAEYFLVKTGWVRWLLAILFLLSVANILFMVQGRVGYLALLTGFVVFLSRHFGLWKKLVLCFLAALMVLALLLTDNQVSDRVKLAVNELERCSELNANNVDYCANNTSMGLRLYFYRESIADFMDAPLVGHGAGGLSIPAIGRFPNNANPHNEYLLILAQQGIFGALLWLSWFVLIFLKVRKIGDSPSQSIIYAGLAMFATGCLFNSLFRDVTEGHAFILLIACALVVSSSQADQEGFQKPPVLA